MTDTEKTAAEIAEEERQAAIARGDIIDETDEDETDADDVQSTDADADEPVVEDDADGDTTDDGDESDDGAEESANVDAESSTDVDAADAAEEDGGAESEKPKTIMIPKARFDEAARKAKDKAEGLQAKLDKLEKSHEEEVVDTDLAALETEIETLEDDWTAQLLEGELEKAQALQKQLRTKRKALTTQMLTQQSQRTGNAAIEQIRFDHQLAQVEATYPQLNPDHEDVDNDKINEVNELINVYTTAGFTHTAALQKAVHYVVPADPDTPVTKDPEVEKKRRGTKARKAVNKAAKASPPDITKAGRDSDKGGRGDGLPDVTKMSPEQFAKLSETDLAKLRGDTLSEEEAA
jgi:hypothetical protein